MKSNACAEKETCQHTKNPNPRKITEIIEEINIGILTQCYKYKERCRKNAIPKTKKVLDSVT